MRGTKQVIGTATPYWVVAVLLGIYTYPISRDTMGGESWLDNATKWFNLPLTIALVAVCLFSEYCQRQGRHAALRSLLLVPFILLQARNFVFFIYAKHLFFAAGIISCILLVTAAILFAQSNDHRAA